MSLRGLIFWGIAGSLGMVALSTLVEPEAPVISLESGLGTDVQITRL